MVIGGVAKGTRNATETGLVLLVALAAAGSVRKKAGGESPNKES